MIGKSILTMLVLLMASPFNILARITDPPLFEAMAASEDIFLIQSYTDAPVIAANILKGSISVELPQEYAGENTIIVNVGMRDINDSVGYVGTGNLSGELRGGLSSYVMPGEYLSATLEFINYTEQLYKITDYSFSDGWVYNIGRIYNDAARNAGYNEHQTIALDDEAWYQLNYGYYQLEENYYNLDTLKNMLGHGSLGQGVRIATENHQGMKDLAYYYLFNQKQFTFDQSNYAVNSGSSRPNTENITVWDYIQRTEQNQSLAYDIFSSKIIGEDGLILDIATNTDNNNVGNAYNGAYADFGFTLILTRVDFHTVTYDDNGSTSGDAPIDSEQYQENDTVTVKGNEGKLKKTGYAFEGWTLTPNGSGTVYKENDVLTMGTEDVTLYAKWSRLGDGGGVSMAQYTVFYRDEDNIDIRSPKTVTANVGTVVTAVSEKLVIDGYSYVNASVESITVRLSGEETITLYYREIPKSENGEHLAYVIGYPDDTFRPGNNITRAETSLIFYRLLEDENKNETVSGKFRDVKDEWYAQAVNYLAHVGILKGYKEDVFRPDSPPITRAEFAAVLSRFSDLSNHSSSAFNDVPNEHWAAGYIGGVALKGWITGFPDGTFRPEEGLTRAQAVTMVNHMQERRLRIEDVPPDIFNVYSDTTQKYWAFTGIMEASITHRYVKDAEKFETWQTYVNKVHEDSPRRHINHIF